MKTIQGNILVLMVGLFLTSFVFFNCAHTPPFEPIGKAHTHISQAQLAQADVYFPEEFNRAKELVDRAEKASYNYDWDAARAYADESCAFADLALAKTHWQTSNAELKEAEKNLEFLTRTLPVPNWADEDPKARAKAGGNKTTSSYITIEEVEKREKP